jgi:hypothetical protein
VRIQLDQHDELFQRGDGMGALRPDLRATNGCRRRAMPMRISRPDPVHEGREEAFEGTRCPPIAKPLGALRPGGGAAITRSARAAHAHDAAEETVQPVARQAIPEAAGEHDPVKLPIPH